MDTNDVHSQGLQVPLGATTELFYSFVDWQLQQRVSVSSISSNYCRSKKKTKKLNKPLNLFTWSFSVRWFRTRTPLPLPPFYILAPEFSFSQFFFMFM